MVQPRAMVYRKSTKTVLVASSEAPPSGPPDAAAPDAAAPTGVGLQGVRASDAGPDFGAGECPSFDPDRWTAYTPSLSWSGARG